MKVLKYFILISMLIAVNQTSNAQEKWAIELRPGIHIATQDLGDATLKTGYGASLALGYNFMDHLGVYAAWGWNQFKSDNASFAGPDNTDFEVTGYSLGAQFIHPIANSSTSYLIRAGGIYNHIEVENNAGDITADSGHGWGWDVGAGIDLDLGNNWNLRPQVSYRLLSRDLKTETVTTQVDLSYVSFVIAIAKSF